MSEARQVLGEVKISISESADWRPPGLTVHGDVDVSYEIFVEGVTQQDLLHWAFDGISGMVVGEPPTSAEVTAAAAAFDWPSVFKKGDVVRSLDDDTIGVVLGVADTGDGTKAFVRSDGGRCR